MWAYTQAHVHIQGPCCCCSHDNLSGLHCQLGHVDVWTQAASESQIWVHGPSAVEVCVNVYCLLLQGPSESHVLKSEGHVELVLPFIGPERTNPTPPQPKNSGS